MSQSQESTSSLWIWPFELEEKIGKGGMGVVYRGRFVKNDKRVAVKLLPPDVIDPTILARFEREVQVLKTLRHPNIVYSFGGVCEDEQRFYAMELVEGGTLDDLLKTRGGKLPWAEAIEYGMQMCAALGHAHERGIIHRDVKPGNFLLTKSGKIKLSDFGLASLMMGKDLTDDGQTMGTFRYMAPEQITGKIDPSPQTDLYSLGCVLFRMIGGQTPFLAKTPGEMLHKHVKEPAPLLSTVISGCPDSLDRLIAQLLEKDPKLRPASAQEVQQRLKNTHDYDMLTDLHENPKTLVSPVREFVEDDFETRSVVRPTISLNPKWKAFFVVTFCGLVIWNISLQVRSSRQQKAMEYWRQALFEEGNAIKNHAGRILGEMSQTNDEALEILGKGLNDDNHTVRLASVNGLYKAGSRAKKYQKTLGKIQARDGVAQVRMRAGELAQELDKLEVPSDFNWWWFAIPAVMALGIYFGWGHIKNITGSM